MSKTSEGSEKTTILVIEDDRSLREGLALNLGLQGYEVLTAPDGEKGMQMAFDARPNLIVLDLMMPGWNGFEILKELRTRGENLPVLILSAKSSTSDKVAGLGIGADDYMTKPFDLPELVARIEVMLRRGRVEDEESAILSLGGITLNRSNRTVEIDGKNAKLSAKEFDILYLLAKSPGKVFSRDTILERVWGWDYEGTARTVDNFVVSLRKKLDGNSGAAKQIKTIPKVGYKLEVE